MQIAITDFTAFCVFPTLMHHLQREAPGLRFELRYLPHSPALTELLAGEVDLALGFNTPDEPAHPDLEEINWLRDEYVVISQANRTALTLDAYLAARHLVVTPWNERQGVLDCELERQGYSRQVAMKTPSMLSAPFIIEQSDLLMALPRRAAETMARAARLTISRCRFRFRRLTSRFTPTNAAGREATRWLISLLQTLVGESTAS